MDSDQSVDSTRPERRARRARRRQRRREQRRPRQHDASWLADALTEGASAPERLRAVVGLVDSVLGIVEGMARDLRKAADEAGSAWGAANRQRHATQRAHLDPTAAPPDLEDLRRAAARVPVKFRRLATTAWMLAQLAVSYRAHAFRSAFVSREAAAEALERLHDKNARRFYETSATQGGAFLKVGQLLSARHDSLPAVWIAELSKLQDDVPGLEPETARSVIEAEFGAPIGSLFASFEDRPIAAASIGQVHEAVSLAGERVAVKVQRPGIAELIDTDLELLALFVDGIRSMLPPADHDTIEREIQSMVRGETDYIREAEMMGKLADFFAGDASIIVPQPLRSLCGQRVITSQFVDGRKITDVLGELVARRETGDAKAGERVDRVMSSLLEAYVRMVLEAGVFQADPHPGNLLVTADDRLVVLDFGATKPLEPESRDGYLGVVRAFIFGDRERLAELLFELGFRTASGKPDTLLMFAEILLQQMRDAVQKHGTFAWPTKAQLLSQASELLRQAERDPVVSLPAEFVMIARVFGTLGGLFMHYRPRIDYAKALMPIITGAVSLRGADA